MRLQRAGEGWRLGDNKLAWGSVEARLHRVSPILMVHGDEPLIKMIPLEVLQSPAATGLEFS